MNPFVLKANTPCGIFTMLRSRKTLTILFLNDAGVIKSLLLLSPKVCETTTKQEDE